MAATTSLGEAACRVLLTADATDKAAVAREMATRWRAGALSRECRTPPPDRPARPLHPELLPPNQMPRRRAGSSIANRIALLHAVAHIELNAIDLAWDMVARFGETDDEPMPRAFLDDWVQVGDDEARHFGLIRARLKDFGADYGDLAAHDGLWQAAEATRHDLAARLAIVPMVLEARGLDVTPPMIERLERAGDIESAAALKIIYKEEIAHVAAGERWFRYLCEKSGQDPQSRFHRLVRENFAGLLKPPFNHEARSAAGIESGFYEPLSLAVTTPENA